MIMVLGTFVFRQQSMLPNKITRTRTQKISSHSRVGQRDKLQHLGPGKDEFNLSGSIFPNCKNFGTAKSVDELNTLANKGQAQYMIEIGKNNIGFVKGKWMISDITESNSFYDEKFKANRIDFTCKLQRQG